MMTAVTDFQTVRATHWGRAVTFNVADPGDLIQSFHARGQFYEPEELDIIRVHCPFGSVFCDIGANIGNHSLFVGLFLHPAAILPFEVNPVAIALLRANMAANGLESLVDAQYLGVGLSDAPRDGVSLLRAKDNLGATRVSDQAGSFRLAKGDDLLAGRKVDFLKIDVEGMEMAVLAGLKQTILQHRPRLFVEVDDVNATAFAAWADAEGYLVVDRFRRYMANENLMLISRRDPAVLARADQARRLNKRRARKAARMQEGHEG